MNTLADYWTYKIYNVNDFLAMDIPSFMFQLTLEDVGTETFMLAKGNLVSLLYKDVFLPIGLNNQNPYFFDGVCVYLDSNDDIWLGIKKEEE